MTVSLDEVNFLISRYLRESGFVHTAYVFETESMVTSSNISQTTVPPGALITILQRSLLSMEYEKKIKQALKDPNNKIHQEIQELEEKYKEILVEPPPEMPPQPIEPPKPLIAEDKIVTLENNSETCMNYHTTAYCCKWAPDCTYFISGGDEGKAMIHYIQSNKVINSINMTADGSISGAITSIDITNDNQLIVISDFEGDVSIFDRKGNKVMNLLKKGNNTTFCVRFSPSGRYLVVCNSGTCFFFEAPTFRQIQSPIGSHKDTIVDASWRGDSCVATASADGTVGFFNLEQPQASFLRLSNKRICGVSWSYDGNFLAVCCEDGSLKVMNVTTWEGKTLFQSDIPIHGLKWSTSALFSWGEDGSLRVFPVGMPEMEICKHQSPILCASFSDLCDVVATGDGNGHVKVTDVSNRLIIKEFRGKGSVHDIALDRTGRFLVVCFEEGAVHYLPIIRAKQE